MVGIPASRYDVANLDQWGRLVKSWATHLDYISQANAAQPPRDYWVNTTWPGTADRTPAPATVTDIAADGTPKAWCLPAGGPVPVPAAAGGSVALPFAVAMTVADFTNRVEAAGVEIANMPSQYSNVVIVQGSVDTLVMRLPPKDMVQAAEDDLLNGQDYAIRSFYDTLFGGGPTLPDDQAGIMELHANRIGEYTLNNCM